MLCGGDLYDSSKTSGAVTAQLHGRIMTLCGQRAGGVDVSRVLRCVDLHVLASGATASSI